MIVPSHNPDGMDMVVRYYRQSKGTPYEGTNMPGLYHRYVGHDNNRDFLALTQADTHWAFDNYWPGSTETSLWKNVSRQGSRRIPEGVNMPAPWPGGWWRLSDLIAYELSSSPAERAPASARGVRRRRCREFRMVNVFCPPERVAVPGRPEYSGRPG